MMYTIEVVKEEVQVVNIEGNTLREAVQKIMDLNEELDWMYPEIPLSYEITGVDDALTDELTDKQRRKLVKKARKIWKEIGGKEIPWNGEEVQP